MLLLIEINCDGWWAWPWPLILAFILGALLGWLLSKLLGGDKNEYERITSLEADLDACRRNVNLKSSLAGASSFTTKNIVTDDSIKDDLTKIEGIGPKIQGLLNADGIWSWKQLSDTSETRLQSILNDAGPAYTIHKPKNWAKQALMAHNGEWDKLEKWQGKLKGGL